MSISTSNRHLVCWFVASLFLSACATPPGKLKDSDFLARGVEIEGPVSHVVSSFYEGLRYCGPSSGGLIFVTHFGVPDCAPIRPDGTAVCDLYVGATGGGRSNFVLGRVDFRPSERNTNAVLRVKTTVANKEAILVAWQRLLHGQAAQVCP